MWARGGKRLGDIISWNALDSAASDPNAFVGPPEQSATASPGVLSAEQDFLNSSGRSSLDPMSFLNMSQPAAYPGQTVAAPAALFRDWNTPSDFAMSLANDATSFLTPLFPGSAAATSSKPSDWAMSLAKDASSFLTPLIPSTSTSAPYPSRTTQGGIWGSIQSGAKSVVNALSPTTAAPQGASKPGGSKPAPAASSGGFNAGAIIGPLMAPMMAILSAGGGKKSPHGAPKGKHPMGGGTDHTPWIVIGGAAVLVLGLVVITKKR